MAGNTLTLEFAGDATKLQRAAQQAMGATESVARAARDSGSAFQESSQEASRFEQRMGSLGSATTGLTDAVDSLGSGLQAVADIQDFSRAQAQKLEQAHNDVAQAYVDTDQAAADLRQSTLDLKQAQQDSVQAALDVDQAHIDYRQSMLDAKTAQDDYNEAVKKHGKNSDEAKQAELDLTQAVFDQEQALADLDQAKIDATQSQEDLKQATIDGKQANVDAKQAQLDLNDAMHEANPSGIQQWADKLNVLTPLLSAVVGVMGLVTAAQWLWNSALLASPITWIVLAIAAVIAIIVLIATKTTWFQDLWRVTWGGIKNAASAVGSWFKDTLWGKWIKGSWNGIVADGKAAWGWLKELPGKIKTAFAKVADYLFAPFRAAFNRISDAWNYTIGSLSWSVPGWVPGVGGNSISVPNLPKFHTGGTIPGMPGQEVPIMALAGEEIRPRGTGGGDNMQVVVKLDTDVLIEGIARAVRRRGGNVQFVLGGRNA